MICRFSALILSSAFLASLSTPVCELCAQEQHESEQIQFFEKHIRQVLVKECYSCHSASAEDTEGGLKLDTRAGIRKGGDRGPAVVAGSVGQSLLIEAIGHTDDDLRMPPEKRLPADVIANFEKWIAFAGNDSPEAFEDAVDRLLASPRFGETWARHWLDVARYAESTGKTVNFYYPHAWRYRDYVIAALNADKPYDQFIREQLAGDLMPSGDPDVKAERMIATGFLAIGAKTLNERDGLKYELDVVDEQIDVTTQAFLGITVACARCHDHKFDPIPQTDYYALAGIFRSTETCYGTVRYINAQRPGRLLSLPDEASVVVAASRLTERERQGVEDQIKGVRDSTRNMKDGVQQFFAMGRIALLQARLDAYDGMRTIGDSPLYVRGESNEPSDSRVSRGTLQVMTKEPLHVSSTSSGRLELAEWIASRENPLTAREMVNRVWLQLFGRGLVPTADDFGLAGGPPTHPELLDHLAIRFTDDGWSVKKFIKYVVMSHVYQQSSTADHSAMEVDPDNTLLWRMAPRRLDAECLRDAMLAVSEQLDTTPPVGSVVARAGEGPVTTFGPNRVLAAINDPRNTHRSIYLPVIRDNLPEALALFDAADPSLISVNRPQTTAPWAQGDGRDNNNKGYSMWMAGGGTKGGLSYGATDEYGYEAVEGRVHVHDWHATILHLLGLDHERLTFRYAGRNMRLTDVKGHVVREIIE